MSEAGRWLCAERWDILIDPARVAGKNLPVLVGEVDQDGNPWSVDSAPSPTP